MNVHPIFVHFPIALLVVYTLLEIVRLPIITRQQWWFGAKAVLLITGVIGGFTAFQTGEIAADAYEKTSSMPLVELHGNFALATMIVYGLLALSYLIQSGTATDLKHRLSPALSKPWMVIETINQAIFKTPVLILGAIIGMILVTIVGALGGALVYGPDVDPVVSVIYHLFFVK